LAANSALQLFRLTRALKRGTQKILASSGRVLAPLGRTALHLIVLPIYRFEVTSRLRLNRLALPARGFVLFIITNRYLIHTTIAILAAFTVLANFQDRQAHAMDVGNKSLLYALATDQPTEVVEETVRPEAFVRSANYLGDATLMGIPHIDFDYQEIDPVSQTISIPGTIAALPSALTEEEKQSAPRTRTENYVVQDNDTVSTIAQRFRVNVGTILWNNNLEVRRYIRPGDTLRIPPVSGMLVAVKKGDTLLKLAKNYGADADEIASFNNIGPQDQLALNTEIMIPGGSPPQIEQVRTQIAMRNNQTAPQFNSLLQPAAKPKDLDAASLPKTKLLWPTASHQINQYYGWRHTGLDIDGALSSPLYAAADGVVEKARWNSGGYGLMILLDHANGIKTRYGHASKLFVAEGEVVKRGQVIAMLGSTGRSTGPHVHFEVYVSGKRVNPLPYIR
jgi:murein DD-endopeptidase MepM/ murein hydrolase activator NlpD